GQDRLNEARTLLGEAEARPPEVDVPARRLYEVGNVLLLKTRLGATGLDDAMDHLETLPFIVAPPAPARLKRAARLGRELGLTFYDASFIALAVELDCAYVTADRRLYDRARTLPRVRP